MAELRADVEQQRPLALPYAGFELRIVSFILDVIVLVSFLLAFMAIGGLQILIRSDFGNTDAPDSAYFIFAEVFLGFFGLFLPLYFLLLWRWRGQTIGQMAVHIKVVAVEGVAPRLGPLLLRVGGLNLIGLGNIGFMLTPLVQTATSGEVPSFSTDFASELEGVALVWVAIAAVIVALGVAFVIAQTLGLGLTLFNRERRALHDLLAGTVVVELP